MYINNGRCTNHTGIECYCSPELEYSLQKCSLYYLPWEFSVVIIMVVYIPLQANAKQALALLHSAFSKQQDAYPDGAFIVAGDII